MNNEWRDGGMEGTDGRESHCQDTRQLPHSLLAAGAANNYVQLDIDR